MMNAEMILNDVEVKQEVKFGKHTFTAKTMADILADQCWVSND